MRRCLLLTVALLLGLAGCARDGTGTTSPDTATVTEPAGADRSAAAESFDAGSVEVELEPFLSGLEAPLLVTHAGDGSGRLYVVEQGGTIRTVVDAQVQSQAFLDISELTEAGGERGLLGLAFHPEFESNGRFFVNYTDQGGDTIVASYLADGEQADPASGSVLLKIEQPYANHNGGHLEFGPDGYLYIATGDGGSAGDPQENGQDTDALLGKLLRIDVDEDDPYGIPPDNPFADGAGGAPEVWAYGLRNPWRFTFDPDSATLWVGDVGQGELEEIDRVPDDRAGLNFGWNEMEGSRCYEGADCDPSGKVLPITEYTHDLGCSVTGGYVYRGRNFPELQGGYLFADYCSGNMWVIDAAVDGPVEPTLVSSSERALSSFGRDEDGELYVTDIGSGEVLRVASR